MLEFYSQTIPNFIIQEYEPLIDSANMKPMEWQIIAYDIAKNYHEYDGIIIINGTDTMTYIASELSFILDNLNKPIIIRGSQILLSELRSDSRQNLLNSLFMEENCPIHEAALFFDQRLYIEEIEQLNLILIVSTLFLLLI